MSTEPDAVRLPRPVDDNDHVQGPADAPVTLVQYGDYECPYCRALHPVLKELLQRTGGIRFVYRHFPLGRFHPHAARAAQAAEAAAAQDRFWQMHDALFAETRDLTDDRLDHCARRGGLDLDRYHQEMTAGVYAERVDEAYRTALYGGVTGTPTLFLNGLQLSDIHTLEALLAAVTAAGATVRSTANEGSPWLEHLKHFRPGKTRHDP
jgi:protein-disulfide isomerase